MERKLLSLPSFFVLLLIAGIAFLAVPVEDVQATVPTVSSIERVTMTPTGAGTGTALTTGGAKNLFIIKFNTALNVASATASEKFDAADLKVTITDGSPAATTATGEVAAAGITLTPMPIADAGPSTTNTWFTVGVTVPANGTGTITLVVRGTTGSTPAGAFEDAAGDAWNTAADQPASGTSHIVHYNTYNPVPVVTITAPEEAGSAPFEVTFTIYDNADFKTEPTFMNDGSDLVDIVGGSVTDVGTVTEVETSAALSTGSPLMSKYTVATLIKASASSVVIGVKAGVVTDAGGKSNAAISATKTDDELADGAVEVMVDTVLPVAVIEVPEGNQPVGVGFTAKFTFTDQMGSGDDATHPTLNRDAFGDDELAEDEVTASNASITGFKANPEDFKSYIATVTPNAGAEKVVITVAANAVEDAAGNGNAVTSSRDILTGFTAPVTPDPSEQTTGIGGELTGGKKGFTFKLPKITPSADDGSRFVVIAKSADAAMNGVSGTNYPVVDIRDDLWQDIRDFLAYDGGTIDLIGPSGTTAEDLVISEVMWGSDNGLSDPTMSQWIELYNTKTTRGTADGIIDTGDLDWTIEFISGATSAANVSDRFSNRQLGQSHWTISDTSGGKYGQSGRTKLSPGVAGTLRDLVSMRRKIDYNKVEKIDHKGGTGLTDTNGVDNRKEQLNGVPDGTLDSSWEASTSRRNLSGTRKGTPGEKPLAIIGKTTVNRGGIVFNEIANRSGATNDWIELHNRGSSDVTINKYELSKVGDNGKDEKLFQFASDEDVVIPGKGYLLVVNTDPSSTNIAEGADVNDPNGEDKGNRGGSSVRYYQTDKLNIPDDKFMLVLRTEPKLGSHEKIADIAGNQFVANTASATEVWPLRSTRKPVHADALNDLKKDDGKSWVRDFGKGLFHHEEWKTTDVKGPGYKRSADTLNSGTPGYPNNAVQGEVKSDGLTNANPVVISEIMFGSGNGRVPQWIELFNPSMTQTVNLENWTLEIQNTKSPDEDLRTATNATLKLKKIQVHPNQTVLIVSTHGSTSKGEHFPASRVYNLWNNHKTELDMSSRRDAVLSSIGFYLSISDPKDKVVDEVGNTDGNKRTNDDPDWVLPGGNLEEGGRASMIRREGSFSDGTVEDAWISAAIVDGLQKVDINDLYYGDEDDLGTPGYRAGGPLPVQLSSFYSKRNDSGAVVITWSTESELDNAGFNILRSQSRTGEFVRINAQLIPGAGTTGEKTAYTWTDTSAKPNVLYFYQIEDVSLAGDHRTLRTTRLRGYIGAAGKATTTWGDLKSRE